MTFVGRPAAERFFEHVDQNAPVPNYAPNLGPCWLWTGFSVRGYGRFTVAGASPRTQRAHRYAYQLFVGPIPEGLTLDHLCRVTLCVNPAHLEAVTNAENNRRVPFEARNHPRWAVAHCSRGHLYDACVAGRRVCRTCANERNRRYRQRGTPLEGRRK